MTPMNPNPQGESNGKSAGDSLADELRQERERLRQLAEKLEAREQALNQKEEEHKYLVAFAYGKLREYFDKTVPELPPDKDLETIAREENALPLEAFIDELERMV